ncbi:hypothetical protein ANCDUO_20213, partial [Ancylostoma duodenale]
ALSCQHLDEMANSVAAAGRLLVAKRPETETTVALRINTINSAMEQLRLRRCTSDSDTCSTYFSSGVMRNVRHKLKMTLEIAPT